MFALYKKDLRSYFSTPLGYVFCGVFFAVAGFMIANTTLYSGTVDVTGYFQVMIFVCIILVPILTMKSFSDERRQKTDQLLLTSPIPLFKLVMAKFLASYTLYAVCFTASCLYFIGLTPYGTMNEAKTFGCYLAVLLIGMCFVAVGVFVSALTENIVTAAVGSIALLAVMSLTSMFNSLIDFYPIRQALSWISVLSRFSLFGEGIFDFSALVYYFSLTTVFLFLAVRVLDRRRWA